LIFIKKLSSTNRGYRPARAIGTTVIFFEI
jgi:hypothetical protein